MSCYLSWKDHSVEPLQIYFRPGFQFLSRIGLLSFNLYILPSECFDLIIKFSLLIRKRSYYYVLSFNRHLYKCLPLCDTVTTYFIHTEVERKTWRLNISWTDACPQKHCAENLGPGSSPWPGQNFFLSTSTSCLQTALI